MRCLEKEPVKCFANAIELALEHCKEAALWTREQARTWWEEIQPRIDDWRAKRDGMHSSDLDSVFVDAGNQTSESVPRVLQAPN
jgi:hypothetical protein